MTVTAFNFVIQHIDESAMCVWCVCLACLLLGHVRVKHVWGGGRWVGGMGTSMQYLPRFPGGLLVCGIIII